MQVNEQMKQMMSMGGSDVAMAGTESAGSFGEPMFRTESPAFAAQTESPAPYNIDLPIHYGSQTSFAPPQHSATLPVEFAQQQQQFNEGYYPSHMQTL